MRRRPGSKPILGALNGARRSLSHLRAVHAARRSAPRAVTACCLLLRGVDDLAAAVLLPAAFVVVLAGRTLFAVAHDIELTRRRTGRTQRARHGVAAALAQAHVVFTRAALVGVAFQRHLGAALLAQVSG